MAVDFSTVKEIAIPEGKVTEIRDNFGRVIWKKSGGDEGWKYLGKISDKYPMKIYAATYGKGTFVVSGLVTVTPPRDYEYFFVSTDGKNWSEPSMFSSGRSSNMKLFFLNDYFLYTNGSSQVRRSADGIHWSDAGYGPQFITNAYLFVAFGKIFCLGNQYFSQPPGTWCASSTDGYY